MEKRLPFILMGLALLGLIILARTIDMGPHIHRLQEWIRGFGLWGPVVFAAVYAMATILALPGAPLGIIAGALFGAAVGVAAVLAGATLGAAVCFLFARYFFRDMLAEKFADNQKFQRLDLLTERHGPVIVAITRLVPLFPFNLLNYALGLTRVTFSAYIFWSALCMIPGTVLYVAGGDAVLSFVRDGEIPWLPVLAVLAALLLIIPLAKKLNLYLKPRG